MLRVVGLRNRLRVHHLHLDLTSWLLLELLLKTFFSGLGVHGLKKKRRLSSQRILILQLFLGHQFLNEVLITCFICFFAIFNVKIFEAR